MAYAENSLCLCIFLVLSVPCAAETIKLTCLQELIGGNGRKTESAIEWDDSQRDVIFVNGTRIPRTIAGAETTLRLGDALVTWCVRDLDDVGYMSCYEIDRTSGILEEIEFEARKRNVISRGTCRKRSEGKKF